MGEQMGYVQVQSTRPQTLAHGLTDSPVGQLAWIVEKFKEWTDDNSDLPEDAVDRDHLLTNVMLYWLTGTAGSSANLYYEGAHAGGWGQEIERSPVPTGVAAFSTDVAIRRCARRPTPSPAGPTSTRAATSPPWRRPTCCGRRARVLPHGPLKRACPRPLDGAATLVPGRRPVAAPLPPARPARRPRPRITTP